MILLAAVLAACASPYRAEGEVRGQVEIRIVEKGTDNLIFAKTFEEDGLSYFDGRWVHVEYISGKTWSYDLKEKKEVPDETARAGLGLPAQ